jgi:hypothetical protein
MTPQEKYDKIVDIAKQLMKISKTIKGMSISKKKFKYNSYKGFSFSVRLTRLCMSRSLLIAHYDLLKSQKTT